MLLTFARSFGIGFAGGIVLWLGITIILMVFFWDDYFLSVDYAVGSAPIALLASAILGVVGGVFGVLREQAE